MELRIGWEMLRSNHMSFNFFNFLNFLNFFNF